MKRFALVLAASALSAFMFAARPAMAEHPHPNPEKKGEHMEKAGERMQERGEHMQEKGEVIEKRG